MCRWCTALTVGGRIGRTYGWAARSARRGNSSIRSTNRSWGGPMTRTVPTRQRVPSRLKRGLNPRRAVPKCATGAASEGTHVGSALVSRSSSGPRGRPRGNGSMWQGFRGRRSLCELRAIGERVGVPEASVRRALTDTQTQTEKASTATGRSGPRHRPQDRHRLRPDRQVPTGCATPLTAPVTGSRPPVPDRRGHPKSPIQASWQAGITPHSSPLNPLRCQYWVSGIDRRGECRGRTRPPPRVLG